MDTDFGGETVCYKKKNSRSRKSDECDETPNSADSKTLLIRLSSIIENNHKLLTVKLINLSKSVDDLTKKMDEFSRKLHFVIAGDEGEKNLEGEVNSVYEKIMKLNSNVNRMAVDVIEGGSNQSLSSDISNCLKVAMTTGVDRDTIRAAYEDVRSDGTPTDWAVFKFEGARIVCAARGSDFSEFRESFGDNDRAFGYIRLQMGDEMSKRRKFLFVTWVGPDVSVINRAKMSTDKALVKDIISNFAVELQLESQSEIDVELFREALNRAGGANYGTGVRDL